MCVTIEQVCSDYYKLQMMTVRSTVGYEGQMRAQNDGELKGYKVVIKVLWRYQYRNVVGMISTLLDHNSTTVIITNFTSSLLPIQ